MTDSERQLIEAITQQVMQVLKQGTRASGADSSSASHALVEPAAISPPIGECTGDYSKFPELAGRDIGAHRSVPANQGPAPQTSGTPGSPATPLAEPLPLTGIVTAGQLQSAMDGSLDRAARLAADARLTPLANDLARQFPQRVIRVNGRNGSASKPAGAPLSWLWWADGPCSAVDSVVEKRRRILQSVAAGGTSGALVQVVRDLAASIRNHRVAGGVLFVSTAAQAMCLANRCLSIRAVMGTCDEAVEQGIHELGANVLVLEYPFVGARAMAGMIDRFTASVPQPSPAIERTLAELHRCG